LVVRTDKRKAGETVVQWAG
jgi:hypothetical protein